MLTVKHLYGWVVTSFCTLCSPTHSVARWVEISNIKTPEAFHKRPFVPPLSSSKSRGCHVPELRWVTLPAARDWHILKALFLRNLGYDLRGNSLCAFSLNRNQTEERVLPSTELYKYWKVICIWISYLKYEILFLFILFCFCCHKIKWGVFSFRSSVINFNTFSVVFWILLFLYSV